MKIININRHIETITNKRQKFFSDALGDTQNAQQRKQEYIVWDIEMSVVKRNRIGMIVVILIFESH